MKKLNKVGGGAKNSSTSLKATFRPLIASSLALALGVNVASADITITDGSAPIDFKVNGLGTSTASGYDVFTNGGNTLQNLMIWIGGGNPSFVTDGKPNPELQINSNITLSSTAGISMGNSGDGTLYLSSYNGDANRVLNLNITPSTTTNHAIKGNLSLEGSDNGTINATLGGAGISGTLTLKSGKNNLTFNGSAKVDGNTTIQGGSNVFNPTSATVFGGTLTVSGGYTTLIANSSSTDGVQITSLLSNTTNTLSGGTLAFSFASGVADANKIFNLDVSKVGASNPLVISGGTLSFVGAKQVFLNTDATAKGGTGTLSLNGASVEFVLDSSLSQAGESNPFVKGNLTLSGGGATFRFKDTSSASLTGSNPFTDATITAPSNTYFIDGNITLTNGSISAFWDDTKGFYAKVSTTTTHSITVNEGLIGKNDAWFSSVINAPTIQATRGGVTHLVFDQKETMAGKLEGSGADQVRIAIKATNGNATNILFQGGATITGNITQSDSGYNKITFGATSTVTGDIIAQNNVSGNLDKGGIGNTLVFKNGGTITGKIITKSIGQGWADYNTNNITFGGTANATISGEILATDGGSGRGNVITFNGSETNKIIGNITTDDTEFKTKGRTFITFSSASKQSIVQGNITTKDGETRIDFAGQQATLTGDVVSSDGTKLYSSGTNRLNFQATSNTLTGDISASTSGRNLIVFSGTTNQITKGTKGEITANGASNSITAEEKTLTIGESSNRISVIAKTTSATSSNTISAQTLNAYFGSVKAGEGSYYGKLSNEITADNGMIDIQTLKTELYNANEAGDKNNTANNTITLKSGTLNVGTITTTAYYDRESRNEFNLGQSGNVTANVTGAISVSGNGGETIFNVSGSGSTLTFGGNISTSNSGVMNISLNSDNTAVTFKGANGYVTTLTAVATATSGNTITLDATNNSTKTEIGTVVNGNNLNAVFNGDGDNSKTATLVFNNANGTTLKSVSVKSGANTGNFLEFGAGSNSILGNISIGSGQDLNINLSGATSLSLTNGFSKGSGSAKINVKDGANATLSGGAIDTTKLSFEGTSTLTINNGSASLGEINIDTANATLRGKAVSATTLNFAGTSSLNIANAGATITGISVTSGDATLEGLAINNSNLTFADDTALTLNNAGDSFALVDTSSATANKATLTIGNGVSASIAQLKGDNLKVGFSGSEAKGSVLKINNVSDSGTSLTLESVSMGQDSTNNTLDLSNLDNAVTSITFTDAITVGKVKNGVQEASREGLSIRIKGLSVSGGRSIVFAKGLDTVNGVSTLSILDGDATLTAGASKRINLTNLDISAKNASSTVTFESTTTIGNLTAQADKGSNLVVGTAGATTSLIIGTTNSTLSSVTLVGNVSVLEINGGTQTISNLVTTATANTLTLANNNLTLGTITNTGNKPINVELTESILSLASSSTINSLVTDGKSVINLAVGHNGTNKARAVTPKLTIGNLEGDLKANILVSKAQTDQIKINDATNPDTTLTLYARGNASEILSITQQNKVYVADTSAVSGKNVDVVGGTSDLGGLLIKLDVKNEGNGSWYIGDTKVEGVDQSFQEVASSALAVNYDLYLANFNSLNKRMGELRDNPYNQGVWARVFGGAMSNDIGAGSKTNYVTAQAGYDYSLTLGDARNYMGIAVAYGSSWTKANEGVGLTTATLDNINSKMAEVGIYNSYVADSGWYNDTIFKFDYIMSDFDITVQSGGTSTHSTNNFAMVLSDEFGYRYKFAENEKGNWYIDPQVEMAFGYFNQSDFNQAIANNFTTVEASQDAILTLRTRAGMSLGKKFISAKGFATLYVGAFYEYDYIDGGNAQAQVLSVSNSLDRLESNGRAIVNIGSNIELTDGVRMYIDVEKSFGDKQRTDMQFNFGARYSFGDKTPSTSYLADEKKRSTAPLKVEEKPQAQESKAEAPQTNTEVKQ